MNTVEEFVKKICNIILYFNVEIGIAKNPELARKQEYQVITVLSSFFPEYLFVHVTNFLNLQKYPSDVANKIESQYGDIFVLDKKTKKLLYIIELKVGTKPKNPNGEYYGAPTLLSLDNKAMQKEIDKIPRLILCISQKQNYRICNLDTIMEKVKNNEIWFVSSNEKEKNQVYEKYNGKVRVGINKEMASKENVLHIKDFIPSYLIARHEFDFV